MENSAIELTPNRVDPKALTANVYAHEPMDVDEAVEILQGVIRPYLNDPIDLATFRIRPGVTLVGDKDGHPVVEVFLRDRVHGVPVVRIAKVLENKTLDVFAQGLLEKLRTRHFYQPISYRRIEVLREILYEMEDLLPGGAPEVTEFPEGSASYYRLKIDRIREAVKTATRGPASKKRGRPPKIRS